MKDGEILTFREVRRALRRIKNTNNCALIPADTLADMIAANAEEYRKKDYGEDQRQAL